MATKANTITVKNIAVNVLSSKNNEDYISLTDIARYKDKEHTDTIIQKLDAQPQYGRTSGIMGKYSQSKF